MILLAEIEYNFARCAFESNIPAYQSTIMKHVTTAIELLESNQATNDSQAYYAAIDFLQLLSSQVSLEQDMQQPKTIKYLKMKKKKKKKKKESTTNEM